MNLCDEIEQRLRISNLDNKQLCWFAWLCGLRALPFLSVQRDFTYWPKDSKQKHLYSVFNALDVCIQATLLNNSVYDDDFYVIAPDSAGDVAVANFITSVDTAATDITTINAISADIANSARLIARANTFADAFIDIDNATAYEAVYAATAAHASTYSAIARDAIFAATTAHTVAHDTIIHDAVNTAARTAAYTIRAANELALVLKGTIFDDIEKIAKNKFNECTNDKSIYGKLWDNFQDDLKINDCAYWARLYEDLFNNGFDTLDKEELRLRLDVSNKIKAKGAKAVAEHITALNKQGATDIQRARLILIGSARAGKTTLARKLKDENAKLTGYVSTHGVDRDIEIDFNGVKTQIWDFGGQVIYHASYKCFMSDGCIYVLVVNARENDDYSDTDRIEYWLDTVNEYAKKNVKIFIVINEEDDLKYNFDDIRESLKAEYKDLKDVYAFNIGSDKESLRNFKDILSEYIESRGSQKIGLHDKAAFDEIKLEFEKGTKFLKKENVYEILDKYGVEDADRALNLFNILGIALHYNDVDDLVIDPYWITHGIYKLIDHMQKVEFKQPVYLSNFKEIFKDESNDYPKSKLKYIFELMTQYKIGFRNSGVEGLFVPCVAAFRKSSGTTKPDLDNLIVKYNRDKLKEFPADFFGKFIAYNAEDMNKRNGAFEFWRTGMVLINNDTNAIVEILQNREIVITAWGKHKGQYVDTLIGRFDKLLKEFGYAAIGNEEKDLLTGKKEKKFKIFSESIIASVLAKAVVEGINAIQPYLKEFKNTFFSLFN